ALANAIHGIAARQPAASEQILVGEPPLALDVDDLHAVTLAAAARPRVARVDAVRCGVEIALLGRQIRRARRRPRERCAPRLGAGARRSIRRRLHVRARDVPARPEAAPDLRATPSRPWPLRHSRRPPRARLTTLDPPPRVARDTSTTRSA